MKVTDHLTRANGKTLFSFEVLPPKKGENIQNLFSNIEPLMADEAEVVTGEMSAGLTFPQALKRMADRVDLEELTTLARLINQASQLGASITQALREYSEAAFNKRMMSLEEHAGKISAMLVMPLTLCFLPACILAVIAPAIIRFATM